MPLRDCLLIPDNLSIENAPGQIVVSGHTAAITHATFAPDADRVLPSSTDGTARLWDGTGRELAGLSSGTSEVRRAAFLAGGDHIVTEECDRRGGSGACLAGAARLVGR